ncbi:hypothetical protein BDQ12DRAFT_722515 [Crucibulum laeve]|uniref:Uncharacterized protein n=1 Tax=Crucibulum laeve TaxID=68775 RepID=A0A5C3M422_9AGAR|nr:hypothetical protein BDQ12DRAFT_722515 [Crucibulum laeve]
MSSNQNNPLRENNGQAEHNEQPNEEIHELAALDLTSDNGRVGPFNFSEHAGYGIHVDWNQRVAYHYPVTPYHALPPDRRLPALSPVLAGKTVYRPFPTVFSQQNNVPMIIEQSRIPVFIIVIRLSGHTGDIRIVTLSNDGATVPVNDALEAVRDPIVGRQPAFAPAAAMAQMGTIRLDERGRLVWSGFRDGSEGVWELSLV